MKLGIVINSSKKSTGVDNDFEWNILMDMFELVVIGRWWNILETQDINSGVEW